MQFWQKNRKTFATKWKENRTKSGAIYETLFFLKISYHLNDPLDTYIAFLTTSPNCLNCFPQRSASKYLNIKFRSRKYSAIMFSVFIELICDRKAEKFLLKKWKKIVLILIFKNRFSFRESVFLWRFKIQYWLPCWIFYAQSAKRSRSNSEKKQKIFPKQILCPKMSTGHLLRTSDNLAENFPTKFGIVCSNSNKISHFFPKNLFFYKVLC